jgi:hypothetical protein
MASGKPDGLKGGGNPAMYWGREGALRGGEKKRAGSLDNRFFSGILAGLSSIWTAIMAMNAAALMPRAIARGLRPGGPDRTL